jgi:hypothetical protein
MMIIFSLSILDFKFFFFFYNTFQCSIQGGGLYFIPWVFKTSSLKLVCSGRPALAPLHSKVPMNSSIPIPMKSDQTILLLDE